MLGSRKSFRTLIGRCDGRRDQDNYISGPNPGPASETMQALDSLSRRQGVSCQRPRKLGCFLHGIMSKAMGFDKIGRVSTKSGLGLMLWLFIGRCLLLASMTLDIGFWPLTWLLTGSGLSWLRTLGFGSLALGHWSVTGVMGFMTYWCRPELYTYHYYYYTSILPIL